MALYWPDQKVALQIDDDPAAEPFTGPDDWTVIHTDVATLDDFDSFDELMARVARAIGEEPRGEGREGRRKLFNELTTHLANGSDDTRLIIDTETGDVSDWDEEVPEGSLEVTSSGMCMSTPEFYYLREARTRTLAQQIQLAFELCGIYGTDHLSDERLYRMYEEPVTSVAELRNYLGGARDLDGYQRAMKALNYVAEGAASPAVSYLAILLTLPRDMGGYDLFRPQLSARYINPFTLECAPTDEGRYEGYDLCWPRQGVAMQFVGDKVPGTRERRALRAPDIADIYVICVTMRQLEDAEAFEEAARLLADRLGTPLPPSDDAFVKVRNRLREELSFPHYDHMRAMAEDWHWHQMR